MSLSSHDEKTGPKRTSPGNFCVWCRLSTSETATAASGASGPDDEEEGEEADEEPAEASGASGPVEEATAAASGASGPDDEEEGEEADEERFQSLRFEVVVPNLCFSPDRRDNFREHRATWSEER